ncbi:MAG: urea carboxylase-associated family protein [Actinomycetota bacterium]
MHKTLGPGSWVKVDLDRGSTLDVRALVDAQAVELIAHDRANPRLRLSTLVTALAENVHRPRPGVRFWSQDYTPLIRLDSQSTDRHDMFLEACNPGLRAALYGSDEGPTCWENFRTALNEIGLAENWIPYPLGLFRETSEVDGRFHLAAASSRAGDHVGLVAEADLVIVASACPLSAPPVTGAAQTAELRWEQR